MSGRKKDAVWIYFDEKKSASGKFNKAVCKRCNKELMGLVARMKQHLETCVTERNRNTSAEDDSSVSDAATAASAGNLPSFFFLRDAYSGSFRFVYIYEYVTLTSCFLICFRS